MASSVGWGDASLPGFPSNVQLGENIVYSQNSLERFDSSPGWEHLHVGLLEGEASAPR